MKRIIPISIFLAAFVLVFRAAAIYTTESESFQWNDVSLNSVLISAGIAAFVVLLYKILLTKVKMTLLVLILAAIVIIFKMYLKG